MSKHQKALNDLYDEPWDMMPREEAKTILQELVDKVPHYEKLEAKATPKKPIKKTYEHESMNEDIVIKTYYVCGCEKFSEVHHIDRFCSKCGQAIDWSQEDNR